MTLTLIRGETQIMPGSTNLSRLFDPFLTATEGDWDITNGGNGFTYTGIRDPIADQDTATKAYVDSLTAGLTWKAPARVCGGGNVAIATDMEAGDVVDGITLIAGDRVLLHQQSTPLENGVYIVQASGAGVRSADFSAGLPVANFSLFVQTGVTCGDKAYVVTNDAPSDVVNTNALVFVQFAGAGEIPPTHTYNDVLTVTNGSPTVTLSAAPITVGTERVYLNGLRQIEGATEDYTINSSTGVITFNFNMKSNPGQTDSVVVSFDQPS